MRVYFYIIYNKKFIKYLYYIYIPISYESKYLKYKEKYLNLLSKVEMRGGNPVPTDKMIAIIELYTKAFNTYIVWKFRGGSPILNETGCLIDLSNRIVSLMRDPAVKQVFKSKFIEDNDAILSSGDRDRVLFSLRQKTTKVIRYLLLKGAESRVQMQTLVDLLNAKKALISQGGRESDYNELVGKCSLISTLYDGNVVPYSPTPESDPLDYLRNLTNKAISEVAQSNPNACVTLKACFDAVNNELNK